MIKPFLICMLNFLVEEINSLSSSEKRFPREPFIRGGSERFRALHLHVPGRVLRGVWGCSHGLPGLAPENASAAGEQRGRG